MRAVIMKTEATQLAVKSSPGLLATFYNYTVDTLPVLISVLTFIYMAAQAYLAVKKVIREFKEEHAEKSSEKDE